MPDYISRSFFNLFENSTKNIFKILKKVKQLSNYWIIE